MSLQKLIDNNKMSRNYSFKILSIYDIQFTWSCHDQTLCIQTFNIYNKIDSVNLCFKSVKNKDIPNEYKCDVGFNFIVIRIA